MKFQVDRDALAEAVTWTARTLSSRPSLPVLSGVLITADSQGLTLSSFDNEVSATSTIAADVYETGEVLVSGRLLADITRSFPSAPVNVEVDSNKLHITCGKSTFDLATMPVAEYPSLPEIPEFSGTIDSEIFAEAVSQVSIAASKDDTLPILAGTRIEFENDTISFIATDRYRLALREIPWNPLSPQANGAALIKAKTLLEVTKSLAGSGNVSISFPSGHGPDLVGFEAGGRKTTSLLIDGEYPKVRSLFPDNTEIQVVVDTNTLIEATRRVALVAERHTPIHLAFSQEGALLSAGSGDDAQASESIDASVSGEDITVAFNPQFLIDGLNALRSSEVLLSFTNPLKPAVLSPHGESTEGSQNYKYLLMPVRVPQ